MAVEAVGDTTVSWDSVAEVLDAESSFYSRGEKTSEGSNQRGEARYHKRVDLGWGCLKLSVAHKRTNAKWEVIALHLENFWDLTFDFFKERKI